MKWENFSSNTQLPIAKHIAINVVFALIGTSIGIAMRQACKVRQVDRALPNHASITVASGQGVCRIIYYITSTLVRKKQVFYRTKTCS